jgi:hypothetical protein
MKIRSITSFFDPNLPGADSALQTLADFTRAVSDQLARSGYEIQTARLASSPYCLWPENRLERAVELEGRVLDAGFQYLSVGPALPTHLEAYELIPELLAAAGTLFATGALTGEKGEISLPAVRACGEIIVQTAAVSPDGFANLRFAALANVPPFTPFLPAAYHQPGSPPACAVAVECADTILEVFSQTKTLTQAREDLISRLEAEAARMQHVFSEVCQAFHVEFKGFDFSPAPYPQDWCSLAAALESLGLEALGMSGTLAAAAFLADALDRGRWQRAGFNGLFLPVMEDSILARRAAEGSLTVRDLLLVSSVCGAGLDTVPLPGDSSPGQISALLLDLAVLSSRLNKPLTARLMPIPGKTAGEAVEFDFEYFAKSRVMHLPAAPLKGLLAGDERLEIHPRRSVSG